jgi:fucose 4-O-acetylase-like acetyltransferase
MYRRLEQTAKEAPTTRDRYVDFLRALSIVVVVVGHWFIGMIHWRGGVIRTTSAIGVTPWLWLLTWVAQVMPIFFFVGGFANMVAHDSYRRRGESTLSFLRSRLVRLLRPSAVFLVVWVVVQVGLHLGGIGTPTTPYLRGMEPPGATVPFGPLWFLAVYVVVILVSPFTIALHRRFGVVVPVVMVACAVAVDAGAFVGGISELRWANVAFVWLLPHQLGHFYADGRFPQLSRRSLAIMALSGLAALVVLTNPYTFGQAGERWFPGIGHYPESLLGVDVEPITNTYPPTIALVAMTFWSIGAAMLFRDRLSRWLQRPGAWKAVVLTNSVIMTLFLWHMTAFLLAVLALWPLGFGVEDATSLRWWLERPLWIAVPGVFLVALVAIFGRVEQRGRMPASPAR